MDTRKTRGLPARLERLQQRFEHSRRTGKARSHIPSRLWAAAVTMATTYGVNRTARALRLDYYSLKRVEQAVGPITALPWRPLRIEVPFKDPMEDAVKVTIKTASVETKPAVITTQGAPPAVGRGSRKPLAAEPAFTP